MTIMRTYVLPILFLSLDVASGALKVKQPAPVPDSTPPAPALPVASPSAGAQAPITSEAAEADANEEWKPEEWVWHEAKKPAEPAKTPAEPSLKTSKKIKPSTLSHKKKTDQQAAKTTTPDPGTLVDSPAPIFEMWPKPPPENFEWSQLGKAVEDPRGRCKYSGDCEMRNGAATGMALGMGIGLLAEFLEARFREKPKGITERAMDQLMWMFGVGYLTGTIYMAKGRDLDLEIEAKPNEATFYDPARPENLNNELMPARKSQYDYYRYKIPTSNDDYPITPFNRRFFVPRTQIREGNRFLHRGDYESLQTAAEHQASGGFGMLEPQFFNASHHYYKFGWPYRSDALGNRAEPPKV